MEFFSKVRERLHDELRADLEVRIRTAGKEIESDEQWIMGTSPISDIFRGYYVTKVHPHNEIPDFSECVQFVIHPEMRHWKKRGNFPWQFQVL
jgi:hypothetical protein